MAGLARARRKSPVRVRHLHCGRAVQRWPSVEHPQLQLLESDQLDALLLQFFVEGWRLGPYNRDGVGDDVEFRADSYEGRDLAGYACLGVHAVDQVDLGWIARVGKDRARE